MRRRFTSRNINAIKPSDHRQEFFDTLLPSFGLRVSPSGSRRWFVKVRTNGKQRRLTIAATSLVDARRAARRLIASPPIQPVVAITFEDAVDQFVARRCKPRCKRWKSMDLVLRRKFPSLMPMPVSSITRRHIAEAVAAIAAPQAANQALAFVKSMFSFLVDQGLVSHHPCLRMAKPAPPGVRHRVLTDAELEAVWRATYELAPVRGAYYRILILTAQRRGETSLMKWADVSDGVWTIPAANSKNGRSHQVPLSKQAVAELSALPRIGDCVFAPLGSGWRAKKRLDELSGVTDWVVHDLRRTAATGMASLGVDPWVS